MKHESYYINFIGSDEFHYYFPDMENLSIFLVYTDIFCVGAGINTLVSIADGLGSNDFRRMTEKTTPMR